MEGMNPSEIGLLGAIIFYVLKELFGIIKSFRNGNGNGNGDRRSAEKDFQNSVVSRLDSQTKVLDGIAATVSSTNAKAARIEKDTTILKVKAGMDTE